MSKGYIAGPMRGHHKFNFPSFDAAAAEWRAKGWEIISPAEMDRGAGLDETTYSLPSDPDGQRKALSEFIQRDVLAICDCDAVILLAGWEKSKGATLEVCLGRYLGLSVLDAATGNPIEGVSVQEGILQEATRLTSKDRQKDYGHPRENFRRTAAIWQCILEPRLEEGQTIEPEDVALCMVGVKLARELHRHKRDNLVDACGYLLTLAMLNGED